MDLAYRLLDVFTVAGDRLSGAGDRIGLERVVAQGAQVGRPSRLLLDVDGAGSVFVAGQVVKLGGGTIRV